MKFCKFIPKLVLHRRKMYYYYSMKLEEAFKTIISFIPGGKPEDVPLISSAGRVLAGDIVAERNIPDADTARMDGYAVAKGSEGTCTVIKELSASEIYDKSLNKGECVRVATGAKVPANTDFVVPFENAHRIDEHVSYDRGDDKKRHITEAGATIEQGSVIAPKGSRINIRLLETCASLRIATVPCVKNPIIGVISTGSELVEDFSKAGTVNSNYYHMSGLLHLFDVQMKYYGVIPDDEATLSRVMKQAVLDCDMVVTFGGTGHSRYDLLKFCVLEMGGEIPVESVKISPGKTFRFGMLGGKPLFMFPGTPSGAIACSEIFLVQAIRKWHGLKTGPIKAFSNFDMSKRKGFSNLVSTLLTIDNEGRAVVCKSGKGFPCVTVLPEECDGIKKGDLVDAWLASKMLI